MPSQSSIVATRSPPEHPGAAVPAYDLHHEPVLVIGAGAAGLRSAIALADQGIEPLVIGKRGHGDAHTVWAAGGINAALGSLDPEDSWPIHAADTLNEGHHINDPTAVELVAKHMPDRIHELDQWGMDFDRTETGAINQRYFGAQSFRRTCFVGDRTGEALLETLVSKAQDHGIPYRENLLITRLLSNGDRVTGAVGVDLETGRYQVFVTNHVILAAGGYAGVYDRHSSRVDENNGDGAILAFEAGATLQDIEFVQFHPTGMMGDRYGADWDGRLVTEAVRGEGGRLFNADGERFMTEYSPDQMELDARDVVARAIDTEVAAGRGTDNGGVYLDISHRDDDFVARRLPRMTDRFDQLGVDLANEPVEVAPTAHYAMGGVAIDFETGATGVDGLSAVGETVAGVHGANRLGGNSLAETVAIGKLVGDHVAATVSTAQPTFPTWAEHLAEREIAGLNALTTADGDADPKELITDLGLLVDEHAGIRRDADTLEAGLEQLATLRDRAADIGIDGDQTSRAFEFAIDLSFSLELAELLLRTARERAESRGAHYRTDYPERDPAFRSNLLVTDPETLAIERQPVSDPSQAVTDALAEGHELDYHHLE